MANHTIKSFISLLPKLYSYEYYVEDDDHMSIKSSQKAKGLARATIARDLRHQDFESVLNDTRPRRYKMRLIQSIKHALYLLEIDKVGLSMVDTKRYWLTKYESVPFGHPKARKSLVESASPSPQSPASTRQSPAPSSQSPPP